MVLVPEHTLERLQQRQNVNMAPLTARLNGLDHDISDVLKNKQLSDDEKVRQYSQALQNYLSYYNQRKDQPVKVKIQQPPVPSPPVNQPQEPRQVDQQEESTMERDILRTLPKTAVERGQMLLEKIKENPDIMKWDERGQLIYEGEPVVGSHISDLVNDLMRTNKGSGPLGWEMFAQGLAKMNAPEQLLRNSHRKGLLREYKSGIKPPTEGENPQENNDWFPTPELSSTGPIRQQRKTRNAPKEMRQRWLTFDK